MTDPTPEALRIAEEIAVEFSDKAIMVLDIDEDSVLLGRVIDEMRPFAARIITDALAENEAQIAELWERNAALALQADEWEGKYAIVSDLNADLQAQVAALRDALEEIRDYPRPTILNAFNREKCMEHIATKALAQYAGKDHDDA